MRLVLLSDLHLGYRAYQRVAPSGVNQREIDVAQSFTRAIDRIIELAPDVVLVGGDTFHQAHPSNAAIVHAHNQFSRLVRGLRGWVDVVIVGGNHDQARSGDGGDILPILATIERVQVVGRTPRRIKIGRLGLSVLAIPDAPGVRHPDLTIDKDASYNVLLCHGEVAGSRQSGSRRADGEIDASGLAAKGWDFAGFGHFHQYEEVAPRCYYSGSLDFVSSNPWQEIGTPKGFVMHDLATGAHEFHAIEPSRRFVDLTPIDAADLTPEQINGAIADRIDDVRDAVVRLVVENIEKEQSNALDYRMIRSFRAKALNFNLTLRKPEIVAREKIAATYAELRQRSLNDIMLECAARRELSPGVDRGEFTAGMQHYFDLATDQATGKDATSDERETIQAVA